MKFNVLKIYEEYTTSTTTTTTTTTTTITTATIVIRLVTGWKHTFKQK